ncbi:MAG: hypothetical protein KDE53_03480 [Caldilineaceae bacterium]|nr:hypothetical protein [Caldilineaceae bacterium]MCB0124781.1 hypothetical protein [Caldilineaceae bacterium]MCB0186136.1 hypothetical protein [Caldilineaceae bacterium]
MTAPPPACSAQCAIDLANYNFVTAFLAQNVYGATSHYAIQGRLLLSHVELISGRRAIQAFWQGVIDMGFYCAERTTVEVQSAATLANEIGTYVLRRRNGQLADQGTYVALWQWSGQEWQIRYEVWRSNS